MKHISIFIFSLLLFITVSRAEIYEDIRSELRGLANGSSIVEVAKKIGVNPNTLGSFLRKPNATSPKVKQKYEDWKARIETPKAVLPKEGEPQNKLVIKLKPVARKLSFSPKPLEKAPIHIPVRGTADDKDAKGIYFDHYVIQRATGHFSKAVVPAGSVYPFPALNGYIRQNPYALPYGIEYSSRMLPLQVTSDDGGLLIIPGRMRDREYDIVREAHENALLRKALLRGQPVLGICAGAWRVWEALRRLEMDPDFSQKMQEGLAEVYDHSAARMMSFSESTGQVVYNIQLHGVKVEADSLLYQMMGKKSAVEMDVNSVHWKAPDRKALPSNVRVVAVATKGDVKETRNRHGRVVESELDTVEAFEAVFGAPVIGVQWHLEAYNLKDRGSEAHLNILRWMAKVGDVYAQKRKVLVELTEYFTK